ncbi:hypothetical protein FKM82_003111, partial [Ascaphus truei]
TLPAHPGTPSDTLPARPGTPCPPAPGHPAMEAGEQGPVLWDTFQRCFMAGRRLGAFPWETILHPLCLTNPPSLQYRRRFLTELIKKHESVAAEPLDELYDALANVLNSEETTICHKSYFLPSGDSVTLSENMAIISEGTTGLVTWEAALYLAEWAIENVDIFNNRTILELGSGIGLTGLAICKSCFPNKYVFSDHHQRVLQQLKENIRLNGYLLGVEMGNLIKEQRVGESGGAINPEGVQLSVIELNWDSVTEEQLLELQADVVIASGKQSPNP